ncbi:hypothetical protein [Azospirillum brasilense]|uniref:hypothetical protein n=1 Tax=Azospirillum brasilense TaxID=192 RepID=UPI001EDC5F1A|nr:hypothetical protein [Azospirillum brasilense]UKJ75438.1 hypothetical protein H1Q64_14375 [Azospirillum brasilense]
MRTLVVTNCTNRKRLDPSAHARARDLTDGTPTEVAAAWMARVSQDGCRIPADRLYCGRAFSEAIAATKMLDARLYIASAGLGLVAAQTLVPSYGATVAPGTEDSLLPKLFGASSRDWWCAVNTISPFVTTLPLQEAGLLLVALSRPYLQMMLHDLLAWVERAPGCLRLFASAGSDELPLSLRRALMPYDARLDDPRGPLPGTKGDFAQRALRHFVERVLPTSSDAPATVHAERVTESLAGLSAPDLQERAKRSDAEIRALIEHHWHEVGGASSRMLRKLRDGLGVACEQGRFKDLFHQVAQAREGRLLP